jgi:SAM-dependent methyltransferase
MTPLEIGKAYDQIADRWDSDRFNRNNGIVQHERAIGFAEKRRTALDVGCGSSGRLIDLLIAHGFEVDGVDISKEMLARAERRHPGVKFYHEDICTWEIPRTYDFITAWDSIWHVPLALHEHVLKKLFASLNSGGVCIFSAGGLDSADEMTDSYMGPEIYYATLGVPRLLKVVSEVSCICRHLEYDQYPENHVYLIVQKT